MKVMINDKAVERRVHPGEDKSGNKEKIKKHKGKSAERAQKYTSIYYCQNMHLNIVMFGLGFTEFFAQEIKYKL